MSSIYLTLLLAAASPPAEVLAAAESAFAEGLRLREKGERGTAAFRRAAAGYEALRQAGAENADLYRNLGNAHLLAGDLPRAILAYRLGLRQDPADEALRANLAAAREQVVFADGSAAGRPPALGAIHPGWLFFLAIACYAAACVALTRWWMARQLRFLAVACLLLAAALPAGGFVFWSAAPRPIAVVARDGVWLRKGNGADFPSWLDAPLNRGVEAEVVYWRDGWLQIELSGGEIGWVSATEVVSDN